MEDNLGTIAINKVMNQIRKNSTNRRNTQYTQSKEDNHAPKNDRQNNIATSLKR